ncbi:unnamed protein product [Rhizoctonia solani]|uniref:Uncharacterized protein n=1 Tax=Rhizoctonia solani TaxID=456999 RepID=A0A8H3AQ17_9AGAM|nr:unnamed protein product [Rhizoctonia solani]
MLSSRILNATIIPLRQCPAATATSTAPYQSYPVPVPHRDRSPHFTGRILDSILVLANHSDALNPITPAIAPLLVINRVLPLLPVSFVPPDSSLGLADSQFAREIEFPVDKITQDMDDTKPADAQTPSALRHMETSRYEVNDVRMRDNEAEVACALLDLGPSIHRDGAQPGRPSSAGVTNFGFATGVTDLEVPTGVVADNTLQKTHAPSSDGSNIGCFAHIPSPSTFQEVLQEGCELFSSSGPHFPVSFDAFSISPALRPQIAVTECCEQIPLTLSEPKLGSMDLQVETPSGQEKP